MPGKCAWCPGGYRELSGATPECPACSSRGRRAHLSFVTLSLCQQPMSLVSLVHFSPARGVVRRAAEAAGVRGLGISGAGLGAAGRTRASEVVRAERLGPGLRAAGPAPQRCPAQAVAVHGDQGAATLGHLVFRAPGHPAGLHTLRPGALGLGHAGRGEDAPLPPRVALLPVQVGAGGWAGGVVAGPA